MLFAQGTLFSRLFGPLSIKHYFSNLLTLKLLQQRFKTAPFLSTPVHLFFWKNGVISFNLIQPK